MKHILILFTFISVGIMAEPITIGIDLGTTNSVVAVPDGNAIKMIPSETGSHLIPSIVYFPAQGNPIVGEAAKPYLISDPKNTIFSVKRLLGRRFADIKDQIKQMPYEIAEDQDRSAAINIHGKQYTPLDVSVIILKYLKSIAEQALKSSIDSAVITVPANYDYTQREMVKTAGKIAGLEVKRIINEPTAAALAYGLDRANQTIAVFDFGGGTLDVSILDVDNGIIEVKSSSGDLWLGGDDLDNCIMNYIEKHVKDNYRDATAKIDQQEFRLKAKKIKEMLSIQDNVELSINDFYNISTAGNHSLTISNELVKEQCKHIYKRLLNPIKDALAGARKNINNINHIVMVGGSTRDKNVIELIKNFFHKEPDTSINPDEVVACGAAIQAAILDGNPKFTNILLLDVVPLSLGIEAAGGIMAKLIEKNTHIPIERSEVFTTFENNQPAVTIQVFQGERLLTKDNQKMGQFDYKDIDPAPKGIPQIKITFTVDANGILTVQAQQLKPKLKWPESLVISNRTGLDQNQINDKIKEADDNEQKDVNEKAAIIAKLEMINRLTILGPLIKKSSANVQSLLQNNSAQWFWNRSKLWFWKRWIFQQLIDDSNNWADIASDIASNPKQSWLQQSDYARTEQELVKYRDLLNAAERELGGNSNSDLESEFTINMGSATLQ